MENNQNNQNVSEQEKSVQEQNNSNNVAKNKNTKIQKIIGYSVLSYIIAIFGGVILAPLIGKLYSWAFNVHCSRGFFFLPGDINCSCEGFLFVYPFLLALALVLLLKCNLKILIFSWVVGISVILFFYIIINDWKYLLITLLLGILGYLLGKLILKFKNKHDKIKI